jgi:hypothetical protein
VFAQICMSDHEKPPTQVSRRPRTVAESAARPRTIADGPARPRTIADGAVISDRQHRATGSRSVVTSVPRPAGSHSGHSGQSSVTTRGAGLVTWILVTGLTIGLALVWSVVTLRQLSSSIARESTEHLARARVAFDSIRARTLDNLRAHCRVLVEDPRLKSTLATEGVDEATVADILTDLGKLRRTGFLIVLSPEGRVFAQAGAEELRGLDLSGSSPVKKAQASTEAEVGSWVIGGRVLDLSIMAIRFGATPLAYLVVGQAVDQSILKAVADQSGVAVASATGETVMLSASPDDLPGPVFATVAAQAGSFQGRVIEIDGKAYVTAIAELEDTGPSRPRLVLVQPLAPAWTWFQIVRWMIFIPPLLVLVAVLFAMTANRRTLIVRKS